MRVKIQARTPGGVMQDVVIDPSQKNVLALECTTSDVEYIAKRFVKGGSKQRLLLGMIPQRIKTRVTAPDGKPMDWFADRRDGDWIALELTPHDVLRFAEASPGPGQLLLFNATQPNSAITREELTKFVREWPEPKSKADLYFPDDMGIPAAMRGKPELVTAFMEWVKAWPPVFHNSDRAPEAKLIMPNGTVRG